MGGITQEYICTRTDMSKRTHRKQTDLAGEKCWRENCGNGLCHDLSELP